jgi:hypothetical protein
VAGVIFSGPKTPGRLRSEGAASGRTSGLLQLIGSIDSSSYNMIDRFLDKKFVRNLER